MNAYILYFIFYIDNSRHLARKYIHVYVIGRLGGPYGEKLYRGHFQARGHSFSTYGQTLKPANNMFIFSTAVNWF